MRRSFYIPLLLWFLGIFTINTNYIHAAPGDSVKPIPRIDKEFLIVVHIVYDKDTTPVDKSQIAAAIASTNSAFAPIGVSFKICEYRDIYNFTYDTLTCKKIDPSEVNDTELIIKYKVDKRINIFLVSEFTRNQYCGYATLKGITNTPSNKIVLKKDCANPAVVVHEFGHYFGLPHTFEGNGIELANGSNCTTAGDGVCDTPADPFVPGANFNDYVDNNCVFIYEGKDSNGDYYDPDVSNIMSYYPCGCMNFTRGQYEKMVQTYLSNPVMW